MFDTEEEIIKKNEAVLREPRYQNDPLFEAFMTLCNDYKKLYKQFSRILKMSDRQQIELKESQDVILKCNIELTCEIQERQKAEQALQEANKELERLAALDGLTQIANRRRFNEYIQWQWSVMAREQTPLSLILCDIDFFKRYNDSKGHLKGDDCLKQVAHTISLAARRPADLAARYGGEEFAVVLPRTRKEGAFQVAQAIMAEIKQLKIQHTDSPVNPYITLSMGIAEQIPHSDFSPNILIIQADQALYQAKDQGRNQIILFQP